MPMAVLSLIVIVVWLGVVIGLRSFIHYRRTGILPVPKPSQTGSAAWWARLVASVGMLFTIAAPIAELLGFSPIGMLDRPPLRLAGFGLAVAGIIGAFVAQSAMGDSWRGDVDPDARTPLVTGGPFGIVRNPVLACTLTTILGLALMVPNLLAFIGLGLSLIALEVQVRLVEEPYLLRVHGDEYRAYAARTGRFLPWIGRLRGG